MLRNTQDDIRDTVELTDLDSHRFQFLKTEVYVSHCLPESKDDANRERRDRVLC